MKLQCSLPCLQQPATEPYPESHESSPRSHIIFLQYFKFCKYFSHIPCVLHAPPSSYSSPTLFEAQCKFIDLENLCIPMESTHPLWFPGVP